MTFNRITTDIDALRAADTVFYMAEEWRVSVILAGRAGVKRHHRTQLRALLVSGLGDDVTISAGNPNMHIYMYAATAQAAEQAEHVARQALAQLGLNEDCRLERWDSSSQEWLDVRSGLPEERADPRAARPGTVAGKVVTTIVGAVLENFIEGN